MAVASTVTVNITAETAKFENGLKKAKKAGKGFSSVLSKSFKLAATATAGLTIALTVLTRKSLETVDAQRKTARTIGTTQRVFAGLSLAAGISGVAIGSFEKALKKQQKAIIDAHDGLLTQKKAFDRLGLSTDALLKMPVEEQFKAITTALGGIENATVKVGAASDIFGAKNTDLINILELGEAGLDSYINKVDELGVALTDKQTGNIEEANDAILVMKTAFTGLGNQIAARVSPVITSVAEVVETLTSRVTQAIPKWTAWAAEIFGVRRELENLTLADINEELRHQDANVFDAQNELARQKAFFRGNTVGGVTYETEDQINKLPIIIRLQEAYNEENKRYNDLIRERLRLKKEGEIQVPDSVGGDDGITGDLDARKFQADFDAAIRAVATPLETLQMKIASIRSSLADNPLWTPELAGRQAANAVDAYLAELDRMKAEADKLIEAQQKDFEAAALAVATPSELLQSKLDEIRKNLETNPFWTPELAQRQASVAVDAYLEEMKRLEEQNQDMMTNMSEFQRQAFSNMQDILAEYLFDPWEDGLDGMLKAFVDMLRRMVAQIVATKILEYLFGLFGGVSAGTSTGTGPGLGAPAAIGGNRPGGVPLLVGERGPELFTPGASGAIRPIGAVTVEQSNTFGGGGDLDVATLIPILDENNKKLKGELLEAFDRGSFG